MMQSVETSTKTTNKYLNWTLILWNSLCSLVWKIWKSAESINVLQFIFKLPKYHKNLLLVGSIKIYYFCKNKITFVNFVKIFKLIFNYFLMVDQSKQSGQKQETKRDITCKICNEKPLTVMFLPCRHLISCTDCIFLSQFCTICETPIKAFVAVDLK